MRKMNFFLIGLLLISVVVMSGCTDNKKSENTASNSTMPHRGSGNMPGNMSSNSTMPPGGNQS